MLSSQSDGTFPELADGHNLSLFIPSHEPRKDSDSRSLKEMKTARGFSPAAVYVPASPKVVVSMAISPSFRNEEKMGSSIKSVGTI